MAGGVKVDMDAHTGLRGAAAVWVMVFHCVIYSTLEFSLEGSSLMPLFFVLSGFSLAAVYGCKYYTPSSCCCYGASGGHTVRPGAGSPPRAGTVAAGAGAAPASPYPASERKAMIGNPGDPEGQQAAPPQPFATCRFYQNRLARILPAYWLCVAIALPVTLAGFGSIAPDDKLAIRISTIESFLGLVTIDGFMTGSNIDGPGWTVCTLLFFWLLFPHALLRAQRLSDAQLLNRIALCYWVQFAVAIIIFFLLLPLLGFWPAFAFATMWPPSRWPVFCMGLYAGLLCARHPHDPLPWFGNGQSLLPPCGCCGVVISTGGESDQTARWARAAYWQCVQLLAFTLGVTALDNAMAFAAGAHIYVEVWLQCLLAYAQTSLVVALTRSGAKAWPGAALRTRLAATLGKLSMAIYLIHYPLIYYLCWALHGSELPTPDYRDCGYESEGKRDACDEGNVQLYEAWARARQLPVWGIPVVCGASVVAAIFIYYCVEEPGRRLLRR